MLNVDDNSFNIQHSTLNIPRLSLGLLSLAFLAPPGSAATATPGYIDDRQCATCHSNIAQPYKQVGMSKAFYRPRAHHAIQDFAKLPLHHARSGDLMELRWRDSKLVFR